jgi:hypothetical protein
VILPQHDGEQIGNRAAIDDECAVHVGFAKAELRIEQDLALRFGGRKAHCDRSATAVAKNVCPARCGRNRQRSLADEPPQECRQQPIQARLHALIRSRPARAVADFMPREVPSPVCRH